MLFIGLSAPLKCLGDVMDKVVELARKREASFSLVNRSANTKESVRFGCPCSGSPFCSVACGQSVCLGLPSFLILIFEL